MDGRDYKSVKEAISKTKNILGPINIVVNNAAQMGHNISIAKTTIEEWDNEIKTCLNSAFYCIKETWADMCSQNWGSIINITSVAGVLGGYGQSSYGAAKAGLIAMAKSAALEGARYNITANCILIGIVRTESFTDLLPLEVQERVSKKTVWGKAAETKNIASAAAYLVSEDAHYMTGAVLNMMGGFDLFVF
jgi:3-oxoacyl-[acyl-carrier protein] reductase